MNTDILIQELLLPRAAEERLRNAAKRDIVARVAATQPSHWARIRNTVGAMLIAAGEYLRRQPAPATNHSLGHGDLNRGALERRTRLSW